VGDAGQDEEEGEFGEARLAESGGEAEGIGDLFEDEQEAEDEAEGGVRGGEVIEVATEGALEGLDAGGVPMGEIGEGAGIDLAVLAEGLAEEDGGPGGAVGDGGDVDVYRLSHSVNKRSYFDSSIIFLFRADKQNPAWFPRRAGGNPVAEERSNSGTGGIEGKEVKTECGNCSRGDRIPSLLPTSILPSQGATGAPQPQVLEKRANRV
jgi:hypothetical protein